jgi:hypothetical protein
VIIIIQKDETAVAVNLTDFGEKKREGEEQEVIKGRTRNKYDIR